MSARTPRKDRTLTRTSSAVAVAAFQRSGAGTHGGGKRRSARRDRQSARRALQAGREC